MIKYLVSTNVRLPVTLFHILLGLASTVTPFLLILWFYFVIITSLQSSFYRLAKKDITLFTCLLSYLLGFELLDRMAKTSPYIPYELGKYLLLAFSLLGILISRVKLNSIGIVMLLCILPAAFYDFSDQRQYSDLIFNFFAPLGAAIGITLWGSYNANSNTLNTILRLLWYNSLSALSYVFIKTPDLDEISFTLSANFQTSGGAASNQVATILGFGMFLSFYSWLTKQNFSGLRTLDVIIAGAFAFQGLLTFSRGGMLIGLAAILLIYILSLISSNKRLSGEKKTRIKTPILYVLGSLVIVFVVYNQVNDLTGGKLLLRYRGETEGTLRGTKEKNLNTLSSGRLDIFNEDIELWLQHPFTGVGAGSSRYVREEGKIVASHIEFTRLLSEHGIPGLLYAILIVVLGIKLFSRRSFQAVGNIMLVLYFIAVVTSFHSAMRTYLTPFLLVISSMNIQKIIPSGKKL